MNPYSGEIEYFSNASPIPRGWLVLTDEEAREFTSLPNDERLRRYMERHPDDKCGACGCFIKSHHLNKFKECAATELSQIDAKRYEVTMKEFFDSLPVRKLPTRQDLHDALDREIEKMKVGTV